MEAYEDLFNVNVEAYRLTDDEVKNKLRTLTQGKYTDNVLAMMAKTFKALSAYASWSAKKSNQPSTQATPKADTEKDEVKTTNSSKSNLTNDIELAGRMGLHYNIQIHLPDTRDPAVFDALFKSLRDHLL